MSCPVSTEEGGIDSMLGNWRNHEGSVAFEKELHDYVGFLPLSPFPFLPFSFLVLQQVLTQNSKCPEAGKAESTVCVRLRSSLRLALPCPQVDEHCRATRSVSCKVSSQKSGTNKVLHMLVGVRRLSGAHPLSWV